MSVGNDLKKLATAGSKWVRKHGSGVKAAASAPAALLNPVGIALMGFTGVMVKATNRSLHDGWRSIGAQATSRPAAKTGRPVIRQASASGPKRQTGNTPPPSARDLQVERDRLFFQANRTRIQQGTHYVERNSANGGLTLKSHNEFSDWYGAMTRHYQSGQFHRDTADALLGEGKAVVAPVVQGVKLADQAVQAAGVASLDPIQAGKDSVHRARSTMLAIPEKIAFKNLQAGMRQMARTAIEPFRAGDMVGVGQTMGNLGLLVGPLFPAARQLITVAGRASAAKEGLQVSGAAEALPRMPSQTLVARPPAALNDTRPSSPRAKALEPSTCLADLAKTRDQLGRLTTGKYTVEPGGMRRHLDARNPEKSQFLFNVDADAAVLDAAHYADDHNLWNPQGKAKVVTDKPVGVNGRTGELTNVINVYRRKDNQGTRLVHGSPGNPND